MTLVTNDKEGDIRCFSHAGSSRIYLGRYREKRRLYTYLHDLRSVLAWTAVEEGNTLVCRKGLDQW